VSHFTESRSNPDEDRLLIQLFDPAYQKNNLLTTPVPTAHHVMYINMALRILKLIDLVKRDVVLPFDSLHIFRETIALSHHLIVKMYENRPINQEYFLPVFDIAVTLLLHVRSVSRVKVS